MLRKIQEEQKPWVEHNFSPRAGKFTPELLESMPPLLGVAEEVGELFHAHLKQGQGIRTTEDHVAEAKDAVGDIVIYLLDYCSARKWDMEDIVQEAWDHVKKRDWKADPGGAGG